MGIFQYECMISAATPPQNVGCERCLLAKVDVGLSIFKYAFHVDFQREIMRYYSHTWVSSESPMLYTINIIQGGPEKTKPKLCLIINRMFS